MSHQQNLLPSLCCIMHANNLLSIITHSLVSFLHRSSSTIINRHFFFLLCHSVTVVVPNNVSAHQTKPAVSSCIRTMLLISTHMRIQNPFIHSSSTIINRVFFSFFFFFCCCLLLLYRSCAFALMTSIMNTAFDPTRHLPLFSSSSSLPSSS